MNWVLDLVFSASCLLQDVLLMGEELVSEPYYCQLEAETCRLFSEQLGTFALVGESLHMGAAKRLRLVLFSDAYCSTLEYNIRVYCMDDIQDVFKVKCCSLLLAVTKTKQNKCSVLPCLWRNPNHILQVIIRTRHLHKDTQLNIITIIFYRLDYSFLTLFLTPQNIITVSQILQFKIDSILCPKW